MGNHSPLIFLEAFNVNMQVKVILGRKLCVDDRVDVLLAWARR